MFKSSLNSVVKFALVAAVVVGFGVATPNAEAGIGQRLIGRSNIGRGLARSGVGRAIKVAKPIVQTVLPILLKH